MKTFFKQKSLLFVFIVLLFTTLVIFIASFFLFKVDDSKLTYNKPVDIVSGWYIEKDGEKYYLDSLSRANAFAKDTPLIVYYDFNDDVINQASILIQTKNEKLRAYVDNQQIDYQYGWDNTIPFDYELGAVYNLIDIKINDEWIDLSNKTLSLEITPLKSNSKMGTADYEVKIGSRATLYSDLLSSKKPMIVFCTLSFIIGVIFIIFGLSGIVRKQTSREMVIYLGVFIIIAVAWLSGDSLIFQFLFKSKFISYLIFNFSFLLLPIPIVLFASELFSQHKKFFSIMAILLFSYAFIRLIIYLFGWTDFATGLFIEHILMGIVIVYSLIICIINFKKNVKTYALLSFIVMITIDAFSLIYFYVNNSLTKLRIGYSSYFFIAIMCFCIIYILGLLSEERSIHLQAVKSKYFEEKALVDYLTNVSNRTAFENDMDELSNKKEINSLSAYLLDLNNLKSTNDTYGHSAGDKLIIDTCHCLIETFKQGKVYRIGGDEMVVLLPNVTLVETINYLDQFSHNIDKYNKENNVQINYAIGYAFEDDKDLNHDKISVLIRTADMNMYIDKNQKKKIEKEKE